MNRFEIVGCESNEMAFSCEKNSISQCAKKCLAFKDSLHAACMR